jgi:hypothetical protein
MWIFILFLIRSHEESSKKHLIKAHWKEIRNDLSEAQINNVELFFYNLNRQIVK